MSLTSTRVWFLIVGCGPKCSHDTKLGGRERAHERIIPVFCRKFAIRIYQKFCRIKNDLSNETFIKHLIFIQYNFGIQQKLGMNMLKHEPYWTFQEQHVHLWLHWNFAFLRKASLIQEQEVSQIQICRENSFTVSLCLKVVDSDKSFLLDRFEAETTAVSRHRALRVL